MKVSTDSVLLGAGVPQNDYQTILDVGTGTGILALMTAQRFKNTTIDAVEVDKEASLIAANNFKSSKFSSQINLHTGFVQDFLKSNNDKTYDLIMSNPPFYFKQKQSESEQKNIQKHSTLLRQEELISITNNVLNPNGILALIYPYEEGKQFIVKARLRHLFCLRIIEVYNKAKQIVPKRLILILSKNNTKTETIKLYLFDDNNFPTEDYRELTSAFYLDSHF